ncbi:MAG: glycosyltransferase [Myxococcales bacterium]|nr:glycosyltransferase [Myxococcales bacterium]
MKILYLDQYFSTREGISGTRAYEFARRWVAQGHRVTVLTSASRYSDLDGRAQQRLVERRDIEGIRVLCIRSYYSQQMSRAARLRAFFHYMIWAALIGIQLSRHDVVFASSTPLTIGVPAVWISRWRGTPFVFEVRDLWPQAPIEMGFLRNPLAIAVARLAERLFYRLAARIVTLSPGMTDGVVRAGVSAGKIVMVPNACDPDLFGAADPAGVREKLGVAPDEILIIHAGNLGPSNDGDWLLNLAGALARTEARYRILLLGEGSERERLERRAAEEGITNILFAGPVSRRETAPYLHAADWGIVSFADKPVLATNSPNKFFDYLAAGLPVLVNTPGWTAALLQEGGAGLALPREIKKAAGLVAATDREGTRRAAMAAAARRLSSRFARDELAGTVLHTLRDVRDQRPFALEPLLKRATDLLLAGAATVVLSPFLLAVAVAIKWDSPGPVFFRQDRIGRDGRRFRLWKFRTMVEDAASLGDGLNVGAHDSRITRVGRFLREWSLDELPQLFNMIRGDMAIVGPRPALAEHVAQYDETQRERLRVRPGLTGLAQINGRNALTWAEKLAFDVRYARAWSYLGDWRIILKTIPVVLRREGLYETDAGKQDRFNRFDDGDDRTTRP